MNLFWLEKYIFVYPFRDAELMREKQRRKEEQKGQAQACK